LLKAFAAVNWTSLGRLERDRSLFPALRTGRLGFGSLKTVPLARGIRALRLARFAPLGLVLKALIGEKHLFAGGKYKFGAAFRAFQNLILVLHVVLPDPTLVAGPAAAWYGVLFTGARLFAACLSRLAEAA